MRDCTTCTRSKEISVFSPANGIEVITCLRASGPLYRWRGKVWEGLPYKLFGLWWGAYDQVTNCPLWQE